MSKQRVSTRTMAVIGMFSAVSFIAVLIGRIVPTVAGFLSYDPKDAVVVIAGFILGPLASVAISVIVSFIEMITISATGPYGFIMNIVSTCAFAVPAAWFYRKHHSQKGAVLGLSLGVVVLVICMVIWNYVITPFYMGVPRAVVAGMLTTVFAPLQPGQGRHQRGPVPAAVPAHRGLPAEGGPGGGEQEQPQEELQRRLHPLRRGGAGHLRTAADGPDGHSLTVFHSRRRLRTKLKVSVI